MILEVIMYMLLMINIIIPQDYG